MSDQGDYKPTEKLLYLPEYMEWYDDNGRHWRIETRTQALEAPPGVSSRQSVEELSNMLVHLQAQIEALVSYVDDLEIQIDEDSLSAIHGEMSTFNAAQIEAMIGQVMKNQ